jgi:hypothetical protein
MTVVSQVSRFHGKLLDGGDEGIIIGNYDNLVAAAKDDYNNVFFLGTRNGDAVVIRRDHLQKGLFEEVFVFDQATYGKCGGGSLVCVFSYLVVGLSVRVGTAQVVKSLIVQNCGVNV